MSYLRGPLTRAELLRLKPAGVVETSASVTSAVADQPLDSDESSVAPKVASGIDVRYVDSGAPWAADVGIRPGGTRLEPGIAARVRLLFDESAGDLRHEEEWEAVFFPLSDRFDPEDAVTVDYDRRDFRGDPPEGASYALGTAPIDKAAFFKEAESSIEQHLFRARTLHLFRNQELKAYSRPGESEEDFEKRCLALAEDSADAEAEKIRDRYETKTKAAQKRIAAAERRARELDVDVGQRKQQELIAGAGQVLSMFLGGRKRVSGLSGISSRRSQTRRTQERLQSAAEKLEEQQDTLVALEEELTAEIEEIWERWKETAAKVENYEVPLERTDVHLDELILFWAPAR
jgi:hypothetical protein